MDQVVENPQGDHLLLLNAHACKKLHHLFVMSNDSVTAFDDRMILVLDLGDFELGQQRFVVHADVVDVVDQDDYLSAALLQLFQHSRNAHRMVIKRILDQNSVAFSNLSKGLAPVLRQLRERCQESFFISQGIVVLHLDGGEAHLFSDLVYVFPGLGAGCLLNILVKNRFLNVVIHILAVSLRVCIIAALTFLVQTQLP